MSSQVRLAPKSERWFIQDFWIIGDQYSGADRLPLFGPSQDAPAPSTAHPDKCPILTAGNFGTFLSGYRSRLLAMQFSKTLQ